MIFPLNIQFSIESDICRPFTLASSIVTIDFTTFNQIELIRLLIKRERKQTHCALCGKEKPYNSNYSLFSIIEVILAVHTCNRNMQIVLIEQTNEMQIIQY